MSETTPADAPTKGMVKVTINGPKGKIFEGEVRASMKIKDFKQHFLQRSKNPKHKKLHYTRARLTFEDEQKKKIALTDNTKTLAFMLGKERVTVEMQFKDLGPQISWTTVFLVEYGGPIFIVLLLMYFQNAIYGKTYEYCLNQKLGIAMGLIHYIKREYETLFVHRFSAETMPWTNIIKNSTHYWIIYGFLTMYFLMSPNYTAPTWLPAEGSYALFGLFMLCEFMNL